MKDSILKCLINNPAPKHVSEISIAAFLKISKQRAERLLNEISNDSLCSKQGGYGNNKFVYMVNEDTAPFLANGGYTRIAKREREYRRYDFLEKKWVYKVRWWPFIMSALALGVSIAEYLKDNKKIVPVTEIEPIPKIGSSTKTTLIDTVGKKADTGKIPGKK